ncbi:hypothetical protein C4D60_Mb07t03700 [Musa balbisiana]|uniref:RING-CH-type domain-containing protein n=1 Tax=Musa balbisiana TaxID=52838 RepID=A0A4S8JCV8_MUSBA|nr:hypothetical protein C4D60_Mb07t03700 [Musa balbisiana]
MDANELSRRSKKIRVLFTVESLSKSSEGNSGVGDIEYGQHEACASTKSISISAILNCFDGGGAQMFAFSSVLETEASIVEEREGEMVGHFMVCVDGIIASAACFEPVNPGGSPQADSGAVEEGCSVSRTAIAGHKKKGGEMIECRICQEEGDECDMETPCACNGTLKVFAPNYSVPPSRPSPDVIAIDIRQSWGSRFDLRDSHFLAITAAEQELLNAEYEDYAAASASGIACCRTVALILMLLLLVRQIFNSSREVGLMQDISALFNVSLQFVGFFLPCYVIARSCYFIQSRRRRQV